MFTRRVKPVFCSDYPTSFWLRWRLRRLPDARGPALEHTFYLTVERKALVLGFALVAWVTIGLWLGIYEKLDSGHPRVILRDTVRQCAYGALCLVLFEYLLRLDLSRSFLGLFSAYAWVLLLLFRLTAGRWWESSAAGSRRRTT